MARQILYLCPSISSFYPLASLGKVVANGGAYTAFLMYPQKEKKSRGVGSGDRPAPTNQYTLNPVIKEANRFVV
jgi:hypothetical protein